MSVKAFILAGALLAAPALAAEPVQQASAKPAPTNTAALDAAITDLFRAMKIEAQFDAIIPQVTTAMTDALTHGNTGHETQIKQIVNEEMVRAFSAHRQDMVDVTRKVYADNFSEGEIRDMANFYNSPTGQKFVSKQAEVFRQSMLGGAAVGRAASQEAVPHIFDRMRALNLAVPKGA